MSVKVCEVGSGAYWKGASPKQRLDMGRTYGLAVRYIEPNIPFHVVLTQTRNRVLLSCKNGT